MVYATVCNRRPSHASARSALQALSMTEVNGPGVQVADPQIAIFCGRQMLHMNLQTGQWEPDPQGRQGCYKEASEILSYCQEVGGPEPWDNMNMNNRSILPTAALSESPFKGLAHPKSEISPICYSPLCSSRLLWHFLIDVTVLEFHWQKKKYTQWKPTVVLYSNHKKRA